MTNDKARLVANAILVGAAVGAAAVVLRSPRLRRLAFGLARAFLTATLPAYLAREVGSAWREASADR